MDRRNIKVSIEDLPAEILLIIFKLVFMGSRAGTYRLWPPCSCTYPKLRTPCDCHEKPFNTTWVPKEDHRNPCIFPYATSLVCNYWRSLMKMIPIFWTRVIVFVDTNPTPLERLREQLALSGSLPLDLYVLRKEGTYNRTDYREHIRCGAVINVLRPHFQRCRVISFDVIHNSSLPSIVHDFCGKAIHLVTLELKCRVDDGRRFIPRPQRRNSKPFSFPSLLSLDVDGRNFADACVYMPTWGKALSKPRKLHVAISNFRPILNNVEHPCGVGDVVTALSCIYDIRTLSLMNVEFRGVNVDAWDIEEPDLEVTSLTFTDVPLTFLENFLDFVSPEIQYLHIRRSSLPRRGLALHATNLTLEDILPDEDIPAFLRQWRGVELEVSRCDGFDDGAIKALGLEHPASAANISYERRHFAICDCPNVSSNVLKDLIEIRYLANITGQQERCSLRVTGKGKPLSADDRAWFEKNLDTFYWNTV